VKSDRFCSNKMKHKVLVLLLVSLTLTLGYRTVDKKKYEEILEKKWVSDIEDQIQNQMKEQHAQRNIDDGKNDDEDEDESLNDLDNDDDNELGNDANAYDVDGNDDDDDETELLQTNDYDEQPGLKAGTDVEDEIELNDMQLAKISKKDPLWRRFRFRRPRFRFRFPRFRFPRFRLPRIRLPRIRIPRIRFPRIRFPRIRLPRIRLRRIRFPRIRFRFIKPPTPPQKPNPCPYDEKTVVDAVTNTKCDSKWKDFFDKDFKYLVDNEAFVSICREHSICTGCMFSSKWNRAQCDSKLNKSFTSLCKNIATEEDGIISQDTLQWCNGIKDKIYTYMKSKSYPNSSKFYCACGASDLGDPSQIS